MNKTERRAREIQQAISDILTKDWDPIEIGNEPSAKGEYDGYVGEIYRLLVSNPTKEEIMALLYKYEGENIGVDTNLETRKTVAVKLLALDIRLLR